MTGGEAVRGTANELTLHVKRMPSGWWWLILQRDGRVLELIDTAPSRAEAHALARTLAEARGWSCPTA